MFNGNGFHSRLTFWLNIAGIIIGTVGKYILNQKKTQLLTPFTKSYFFFVNAKNMLVNKDARFKLSFVTNTFFFCQLRICT